MKKLIYVLLLAFTASLTISSCTEEQVEPRADGSNLGGQASEPGSGK